MCVDHAGLALFPSASAFRCVGRLAFPLYCFLLAQGFAHTRDIRAYARRLLLLACVSEIPFDLLIFGRLSSAMEQNVVFSLLLGLLALCAARALSARPLPCALSILALMLLAMVTQVSFGWLGVALCLAYGYAGGDKKRQALFTVLLTLLYSASLLFSGVARGWVTISLCAALSAIPILLYNGRLGPHGKALTFFFYAAYPLHLCALLIVRALRTFWGDGAYACRNPESSIETLLPEKERIPSSRMRQSSRESALRSTQRKSASAEREYGRVYTPSSSGVSVCR